MTSEPPGVEVALPYPFVVLLLSPMLSPPSSWKCYHRYRCWGNLCRVVDDAHELA